MDYLSGLNEPQREGVINTEGPCMLIAGAGSGKTRVLTFRIAHLIKEKGVDPFNILSLTFTNKAAGEMRERIESVVGTEARSVWMGTFHSIFARILRVEAERIGYPSNFTIYDTDDSKTLIRNIIKEKQLDDKIYKPNVVLNRISGAKNRMITFQAYLNNPIYKAEDEEARKPKMGELYKTYCERCFKASAMDFDDLLLNTFLLFHNFPDILLKYQHRFKYVLVDEFQDTNLCQYLITRKIAAAHQNICVVGDDAQSIYAFRGADIQNILNFEKDFDNVKIIKLEQNYRSTKTIVNAANSVIARNKDQLQKKVWTANDEGEFIELMRASSDNEEGKLVASSIFEEKKNKDYKYSDFAILYRTNKQSRAMEEALRKNNIAYKIIGGTSFYQRKEVKDLLGYLRFILNKNDEQALRRIINYPRRGIGDASVDKLIVEADRYNVPLWKAVCNAHQVLPARAANAISGFVTLIQSFDVMLKNSDAYEIANYVAKQSGLLKDLYEDKTIEGITRYENVQELLNAIKEFVDDPEREDRSLGSFLQDIVLLTSVDESDKKEKKNDETEDKVTLMTIHMAKGLEFKNVYLVGMEEDLFPSQIMLSSRADLEEERRLFYVAITRAEKKLFLSYALSRYIHGKPKNCESSRFIEDIDPRFIKVTQKFRNPQATSSSLFGSASVPSTGYAKNLVSGLRQASAQPTPGTRHIPSDDFAPSNTDQLKKGDKVEHMKFGFGNVLEVDDSGSNRKAKVFFENFGEKTLLLSFAKLKICN